MSTKIFQAYQTNSSLLDVLTAFKDFRATLLEEWRKRVDGALIGKINPPSQAADLRDDLEFVKLVLKHVRGGQRLLNPVCSVTVFPNPKSQPNGLLFKFFGLNDNELEKFFEQSSTQSLLLQPASWWNNTDKPDDVDDDYWEYLGDLWNEVLPDGVPARNGFSFELVTQRDAGEILLQILAYKGRTDLPPYIMSDDIRRFDASSWWAMFKWSEVTHVPTNPGAIDQVVESFRSEFHQKELPIEESDS